MEHGDHAMALNSDLHHPLQHSSRSSYQFFDMGITRARGRRLSRPLADPLVKNAYLSAQADLITL